MRLSPLLLAATLLGAACGDDAVAGIDAPPVTDAPGPDATIALPLAVPCADVVDDVYVTPSGLPAMNPTERGAIVRCARDGSDSLDEVREALGYLPGVTVSSGFQAYRVAYRTERDPGVPGVGTARLFVPDTPAAGPLPIIVAAHATAGLADSCAPSSLALDALTELLVLPWVGTGYPVVLPDYAGLGNEGIQGYWNTADTAHSVIDAAGAAVRALGAATDGRTIVTGHSQGGHAALGAQALATTYASSGVSIEGVVSFAGPYPRASFAGAMGVPDFPIDGADGAMRAVFALMLYGDLGNLFGTARAGEAYDPLLREYLIGAIENACIFMLVPTLAEPTAGYVPPTTLGALVDPEWRTAIVDCLDGIACTPDADAYIARAEANVMPFDPTGPPVLLLAAGADDIEPTTSQACLRDTLVAAGVPVDACVSLDATHFTVVNEFATHSLTWSHAVLSGDPPPACPAGPALPTCVP